MRVGSAISRKPDAAVAGAEAADAAGRALEGQPCRLAMVFVSPLHLDALHAVGATVVAQLQPEALLGAVAGGVVGPRQEVEDGPAVSVWCATWDIEGREDVEAFRSWSLRGPEGRSVVVGWPDTAPDDVTILLADPITYPAAEVVDHLGRSRPGHRIVGGLVTAGTGSGALLIGGPASGGELEVHREGSVGVVLRGVDVDVLVSQGCRPIGEPFVVTRAEGNVVLELAGTPAIQRLQEVFAAADRDDQELMRQGLQVGLVADEYRDRFETGDFLIRAVLGADASNGGLVIGDQVEVGQTVQFQVRDAASAHEDLIATLRGCQSGAVGALLFTCNGRGRHFFGQEDHDVRAVGSTVTPEVAGVFCAGEIGPVGQRSFLHGYTASVAVFRDRTSSPAGTASGTNGA